MPRQVVERRRGKQDCTEWSAWPVIFTAGRTSSERLDSGIRNLVRRALRLILSRCLMNEQLSGRSFKAKTSCDWTADLEMLPFSGLQDHLAVRLCGGRLSPLKYAPIWSRFIPQTASRLADFGFYVASIDPIHLFQLYC
jgi:hypothetical protein